jgi:CRP/FNR family cyclic AMP-dependent transcriptional regulator
VTLHLGQQLDSLVSSSLAAARAAGSDTDMSGPKNLKKGEYLFREGDPAESMFVIKSGKLAVVRPKGGGEIVLAELGANDMIGEMAFFDNKPRSASIKAISDAVVIELPFKALHAQFKSFPEWVKAIMKSVNTHLRNANQKIKQLEKTDDDTSVFPPHTVTRLCAIIGMTAKVYGKPGEKAGIVVPTERLRRYTIQVFQQPTNKMDTMLELLQGLGHAKVEDLGEGNRRITVIDPDFLIRFVDFYNDWLFKSDDKRVNVEEKEMKSLRTLMHFGKRETPSDKGEVKVNLTQMQNDSMRELGFLFSVDDPNSLSEKGLIGEKFSVDGGGLAVSFNLSELETIYPYWEIIHAAKKVTR